LNAAPGFAAHFAPAFIATAGLARAALAPVFLALMPLAAHAAVEGVDAPPAVPIELQGRAEPPRARVQSAAMAHLPLIRSEYALVVDQDTDEVLLEKKPDEVSSIASITKLMTAIVTLDAGLPLDEELQFDRDDKTTAGWVGSALHPGLRITRAQALHLALMSSENHAAQLLGRSYPGGVEAAVAAMNAKARQLGMSGAHFADPTGLSPENRASPIDLVRMVKAAYDYPQIREFSISPEYRLPVGNHSLSFRNTNHLTARADWQIGLQKTGYINAAGRCLVMQAVIEGRRVVMVLLDSFGRYSRFADAQRIRDWLVKRPAAVKTGAD
jgi:D-alanyl-D-alanine endopeptidase (penicillin-binding protein 7)